MKDDLRKSGRTSRATNSTQRRLIAVLRLTEELDVIYSTYPKLQGVMGRNAWQSLTDIPYGQVMQLNVDADNTQLCDDLDANISRLEDIAAASLVRDRVGLQDILRRVLMFRISNGITTERGNA